MELHSAHKTFHHSHLGEEKHQMLNLNRRLETYLSRVKLLEEENSLLAKEIQALRRSGHEASTRRKGLEEELRQARWEVDAAWRDRVHTELEVGRLAEELQMLDQQRQREAEAQVKAKTRLEQSKKELVEEQRAQIWLREKVSQLEHEMMHLIQTHQEDVAQLEATLAHSRATMPPRPAQRSNQTPNLLQLEEEYSQRATRAWQEAAEAYQGQLARLEESLVQARSRLAQVGQEKSESQLKLQALEKEIASAQDVRLHLEKMVAHQGHKYNQEIQQLQEHLEGLEAERAELGQQIDHLLLENRGLLQVKMSLGLEVATYRALLDRESLRGDVSSLNQPRNISIRDAVFSSQGITTNYQTQLSACHKTTSLSSVYGVTGTKLAAVTATPAWTRQPVTLIETPKTSKKPVCEDAAVETPYPKILQDGAVESFRPHEVHETVTYAEPLSPPNEREALTETSEDKTGEEDRSKAGVEPPVESVVQSVVSQPVESVMSTEPPCSGEVNQQQFTTPNLAPYNVRMTKQPFGFSAESDKDALFEMPAENMKAPHAPVDASVEKECKGKEAEHVQEETSDSETEAVLEPNFESRTSSPVSEYEPDENLFNRVREFSQEDNISKEDEAEQQEENSCSVVETKVTDVEDKLYPDGEEMDTWDSVIERKDQKPDDGIKKDQDKQLHAEPEEDISTKEPVIMQELALNGHQDDSVASPRTDAQVNDVLDQEHAPLPDNEDNDEEEDSQNVSVSWRTELESDSYAQENTLADTRPLIRYKSDETDANTQASHVDESESSEGEQERKTGEVGSGTWSDGKTKKFGTMEDLCEEVEEEVLDEEYDLGYTHIDDGGVGSGMAESEHAAPVTDTDNEDKGIRKVPEGHLNEEIEELSEPMVPANVDYDEELETDRLVEEELENLATDSYSAHFAQQLVREEMPHLLHMPVEDLAEQEEAGQTKTDDTSPIEECDWRVNHELAGSAPVTDQPHDNQYFSDSSSVVSQADTLADEEVQHKDQEALEKREEEDEHNVSMVTHADVKEDHSGFSDFISRPETKETSHSEEPNSVLQVNLQDAAVPTEVIEVVPEEPASVSQEHLIEGVSDCQGFPEAPETTEWEVLENPSEDYETRDQPEEYEGGDNVPDSAEHYLKYDGGSNEGVITQKEEPLEISPNSVPDENDIFVVKDSTEQLETNGKDNSLHDFFSSGVKNDFWVSSLETGATYQPDDTCNEAAEQTNDNQRFADSPVWGDLENPNVVLNEYMDIDSSKALTAKKEQEQEHLEVKQVLCRSVVEGESAHSEESEAEGDSWSSGEEPV